MGLSIIDQLAQLPEDQRRAMLAALDEESLSLIEARDWSVLARPEQLPPPGEWMVWFVRAGRGSGKTRSAAEWTRDRVNRLALLIDQAVRWALVGPTRGDVKKIMLEGESGLLNVIPQSELYRGDIDSAYNKSEMELKLANGAILTGYSSETPDRLRGPQHHGGWIDEPATFKDAGLGLSEDTTVSNLLLGMRLEPDPRLMITGTPKNNRLIKEIRQLPGLVETHFGTRANLHNLSEMFKANVIARYEGTRLGRQELDAEILDDLGTVIQPSWFILKPGPPWPPGTGGIIAERYWDLASGIVTDTSSDPDFTVGALVLFDVERRWFFIDHIERFRLQPGERDLRIAQVAARDRARLGLSHQWQEREPGNAGKAQLITVGAELERVGVALYGNPVTGDKVVRSEVLSSAAEQGRVFLRDEPWARDFLEECEEFPLGAHDDMVDAVAGAMQMLIGPQELSGSALYS